MVIKLDNQWSYKSFRVTQSYKTAGHITELYLGSSEIFTGVKLFKYTITSNFHESDLRAFVDNIIATYNNSKCCLCHKSSVGDLMFYGSDLFWCKCKYKMYHETCLSNYIKIGGLGYCPSCNYISSSIRILTVGLVLAGMCLFYDGIWALALNVTIPALIVLFHNRVTVKLLQYYMYILPLLLMYQAIEYNYTDIFRNNYSRDN